MYKYFDQILSKYQCGFRQGYNTQNCLLVMVEKWKEVLEKGSLGGTLLTYLSKACDCIRHDLSIDKLAAVILMRENKEQKHISPTAPTLI